LVIDCRIGYIGLLHILDVLNMLDILNVLYRGKIFKSNSIQMNILMYERLSTDLFTYYSWWIMCILTLPTDWSRWVLPTDWSRWILPTDWSRWVLSTTLFTYELNFCR